MRRSPNLGDEYCDNIYMDGKVLTTKECIRRSPTGAMGIPCEWRSFPATILVPVHLVRENCRKVSLRRRFLRSVTPSLVAWMALLVPSQPAATTICVAGLITALVHFSLHQQCIHWNDIETNFKPPNMSCNIWWSRAKTWTSTATRLGSVASASYSPW